MSTPDQPSGRKRRETRELDLKANETPVYIGPNCIGTVVVYARHCDAVPADPFTDAQSFMSAQLAEEWLRMLVEDAEDAEDFAILHGVYVKELVN